MRRLEPAAVQQHDAVVLGQPEGQIERMDVLLQIFDRVVADVLARPELEVDQAVVGIEVRIRGELQAEAFDHRLGAPMDDLHAGLLVRLLRIHQLVEREHGHHHLLRQREPGSMIETDVAAVGDDAVDELELARLERDRAVALVQRLHVLSGSLAIILSKMLSSWIAMTPSRQPVQPKYFE